MTHPIPETRSSFGCDAPLPLHEFAETVLSARPRYREAGVTCGVQNATMLYANYSW